MNRHVNREELYSLLNIPQFESIIYHKIAELKLILRDEITIYQSFITEFRKTVFGDITRINDPQSSPAHTYRFELNLNNDNQWYADIIEPELPAGIEIDDIIPPEIVTYIASMKVIPTRKFEYEKFSLPTLQNRQFHIKVVKYSDSHAMGTIHELIQQEPNTDSEKEEKDSLIPLDTMYKQNSFEGNIEELIYYMKQWPTFREHIMAEFFLKWKPLIDEKLI